jgi:hypothetical protein
MVAATEAWPRDAEGVAYPPEPWHLRGSAYASLWRVPADELPAGCLPTGAGPTLLLGRAVVATAWVLYRTGGVLAYDELLAAVRVRVGGRACATVTHIWVDHPASAAGGRALWGIPSGSPRSGSMARAHPGTRTSPQAP